MGFCYVIIWNLVTIKSNLVWSSVRSQELLALTLTLWLAPDGNSTGGRKQRYSRRPVRKKWWIFTIIGITLAVAVLCYLWYIHKRKHGVMEHTGKYKTYKALVGVNL